MAVWTVSAEQGTGGDRLSASLAAAADVPLFDREALAVLAHELNPDVTCAGTIGPNRLRQSANGVVYVVVMVAPLSEQTGAFIWSYPAGLAGSKAAAPEISAFEVPCSQDR